MNADELWTLHPSGETAVAMPVPVIADGELFAEVQAIWSDEDGVRVAINWTTEVFDRITRLEDLSGAQAHALSDALREAANVPGPDRGRTS